MTRGSPPFANSDRSGRQVLTDDKRPRSRIALARTFLIEYQESTSLGRTVVNYFVVALDTNSQ